MRVSYHMKRNINDLRGFFDRKAAYSNTAIKPKSKFFN